MASRITKKYDKIRLDSAASENVFSNIKYFLTLKMREMKLHLANATVIYESHKDTIEVDLQHATLVMTKVFH